MGAASLRGLIRCFSTGFPLSLLGVRLAEIIEHDGDLAPARTDRLLATARLISALYRAIAFPAFVAHDAIRRGKFFGDRPT